MADSSVAVTSGSGTNFDTRTEGTNSNHRPVVVLGDPATNAGVAPVDATAGLKVDLGADNDVTVTGTVTANLSATDNAVLDNIDADLTTIIGHVDGAEALLTTIDADTSNLSVVGGGTEAAAIRVTIANNSTGVLSIDDNGAAITVDGTVTADLGATDNAVLDAIAASVSAIDTDATTIIGHVDGLEGLLTTIDSDTGGILADTANIETAVQLIDDAIFADDADWTADTSKHALVGGVTQVATTANTDGDVTPLTTNAYRELRVAYNESDLATAGTSHVKKYYANTGAATDGIIWSPAAGKRWYVTDLILNVSAACTVTFEDDKAGGDEAVMKFELAANSGISHTFNTPWYSGEDAADLLITTTAGNVYVTVTGYEL